MFEPTLNEMIWLNRMSFAASRGVAIRFAGVALVPALLLPVTSRPAIAESLPSLDIRRAPDQKVVLSWPEQATDTVLEQTDGLAAENTWQPVSKSPALSNGTYALALETSAPRQYYRLQDTNTAAITEVRIVPVPDGALVPDAMVDKAGVVHMVYGLNNNAYYQRSTNNGASFSLPVKVNSTGTVVTTMGERGPKLAAGADGVIHVVWADQWKPGVEVYVRYARSVDGGNHSTPARPFRPCPESMAPRWPRTAPATCWSFGT